MMRLGALKRLCVVVPVLALPLQAPLAQQVQNGTQNGFWNRVSIDDVSVIEEAKTAKVRRQLLLDASRVGAEKIVSELLKRGVDPNVRSDEGLFALQIATMRNNPDVVRLLLDAGADPALETQAGETVFDYVPFLSEGETKARLNTLEFELYADQHLLEAVADRDFATVDRALGAGADPNAAAADGMTALMRAVALGEANLVARLMQAGAKLRPLPDGIGLLSYAVLQGEPDVVGTLLEEGAEPDAKPSDEAPRALIAAIVSQQEEMVEILREHGASTDALEGEEASPAQLAAYLGLDDIVEKLGGAREWSVQRLLELAANEPEKFIDFVKDKRDDRRLKRFLLQADERGRTVFHVAAMQSKSRFLTALLRNAPAVPVKKTEDGETVLSIAALNYEYPGTLAALRNKFDSQFHEMMNKPDQDGNLPIHRAILAEHDMVATFLADEAGSGVIAHKNREGYTPIELAVLTKQSRVVADLSAAHAQSAAPLPTTSNGLSLQAVARAQQDWATLAALPEDMEPPVQLTKHSDKGERKVFQRWLKRLGYYQGAIDGILGGGSATAMRAYLEDRSVEIEQMENSVRPDVGDYSGVYFEIREYNNGISYIRKFEDKTGARDSQYRKFYIRMNRFFEDEYNSDFWISVGDGIKNSFVLYFWKDGDVRLTLNGPNGWDDENTLQKW